jgi:Concanavalin A-like lectin/glucanases superfamily
MPRCLAVSAFLAAGVASLLPVSGHTQNPDGASGGLRADVELTASRPFEFSGADPGLNLGRSSAVNLAGGDFTVHAWVKFGAVDTDMSIVDKMDAPSYPAAVNEDGWRLLRQADNRFWFCLGQEGNGCTGEPSTTVISQTVAQTERWYSVAATKTGNQIAIYANGVLEGTTTLEGYVATDQADLRVGANVPEGALLNGSVGAVTLYRRALNSGEILALFSASKQEYQSLQ